MNRQRYEPVPQHDQDIIRLDSLQQNTPYNYNSGLPSSVPSSAAPSYAAPSTRSIPASPPPSFHTLSRAGTPRASMRGGEGAELWGVATSTGGALTERETETEGCEGTEALETIRRLIERVDRLEESVGRLLLEKEDLLQGRKSANCCVSFTDASPDVERALMRAGDNCCVSFRSSRFANARRENRRHRIFAVLGVAFIVTLGIVVIVLGKSHKDRKLGMGEEMN